MKVSGGGVPNDCNISCQSDNEEIAYKKLENVTLGTKFDQPTVEGAVSARLARDREKPIFKNLIFDNVGVLSNKQQALQIV